MNPLGHTVSLHPYVSTVVATWLFNNIATAFITSLPAPTKDSGPKYVYAFKVLNTIMGNIKRAQSTAVESSPNFQAAVQKQINGGAVTNSGQAPVQ